MGADVKDGRQHSRDSPQGFRAGLYGLDEPDLARGLPGESLPGETSSCHDLIVASMPFQKSTLHDQASQTAEIPSPSSSRTQRSGDPGPVSQGLPAMNNANMQQAPRLTGPGSRCAWPG